MTRSGDNQRSGRVYPAGLALVLMVLVVSLPLFAPYPPLQTSTNPLRPPGPAHLMGTDELGRDVFSRFLYGGQRTLLLTAVAAAVAIGGGTAAGLIAGGDGFGGQLMTISLNALLAVPGIMTALVLLTALPRSPLIGAVAVGFAGIAPVALVIRARVRSIRAEDYVLAAVAVGATRRAVLLRTILPNCVPVLLSYGSLTIGYCLLNIGALGFLGLIGEPGSPEWGTMLAEGRVSFREAPWVSLFPGLAITLLVGLVNRLADSFTRLPRR